MIKKAHIKTGFLIIGIFAVLAFLFANENYFVYKIIKREVSYLNLVTTFELSWLTYAIFCPVIIISARKFPVFKSNKLRNLGIHFGIGITISLFNGILYYFLCLIVFNDTFSTQSMWYQILRSNVFNMMIYCGVIAVVSLIDYNKMIREFQVKVSETETQLAKAELSVLKMQLHPHFLFNTLHAISALVHKNPNTAESMISRLSDLLRLTLEKSGVHEVPLREEMDFLEMYLDIEKIRFQDRLNIKKDIPDDTLEAIIPSLILQPVVENAIRHGISPMVDGGELHIGAKRGNGRLIIVIADNGAGFGKNLTSEKHGYGLSNIQNRLKQHYEKNFRFSIHPAEKNGTVVTIEIPFRLNTE